MKIEIELFECEDKKEFEMALKLFKYLKYPTGKKEINLEELTQVIKKIELLANYDELNKYMKSS